MSVGVRALCLRWMRGRASAGERERKRERRASDPKRPGTDGDGVTGKVILD